MTDSHEISSKHILTLIFLSFIWGTSFILIKQGLKAYSPVELASLRISIAGVVFVPLLFFQKQLKRKQPLWKYGVVGLTGTALPAFLFALAQTQISSSIAGILNSLTPIFTLFIGVGVFGVTLVRGQLIGVILGLLGVVLLILFGQGKGSNSNIWYSGFIMLCAILYATNLNYVKHHFQEESSIVIGALPFILFSIPSLVFIAFSDIPRIIQTAVGFKAFGFIAILSLMSTVLALILFYRVVQQTNAVFASSTSYLVPIVALLWGFVDQEYIGIGHFLSLGMIIFSVFLIRRG